MAHAGNLVSQGFHGDEVRCNEMKISSFHADFMKLYKDFNGAETCGFPQLKLTVGAANDSKVSQVNSFMVICR